ncbi:MAG: serine hydroxymethyltransferase, partial [Atopobiaceae bacterium]|nr:serine hydroxymethyltransferase [Atopobiaceae bacterium]
LLVDLRPMGEVTGRDAELALEEVGITVNKNAIPNEPRSAMVTSGIRVGSAAATTRGFTEPECERVGELIGEVLSHINDEAALQAARTEVSALLAAHPLYPEL